MKKESIPPPPGRASSGKSELLLRGSMLAAYSELHNNRPESAKTMLRTGLMGGNVNNPLDVDRCDSEWKKKYTSK